MMHPRRPAALALILAAVLLPATLPGCGVKTTPAPTETVPAATTPATTAIPRNRNINEDGTLPIAKNKETIQVSIRHNGFIESYDYGRNRLSTWLEDRTNVHVEFLVQPDEADLAAIAPSAGDISLLPLSRAQAASLGASGTIAPLNSLIDRYGFHLKKLLTRSTLAPAAITASDGNVYYLPGGDIPNTLNPDEYGMRLWVNKGMLARYGQGVPATTDEWKRFLTWVRDADANGNGDAADEIPWTGAESRDAAFTRPTDFVMNAFTMQGSDGYYVQADAIQCVMINDGYRDGLRYLAGLMADGLLDKNYASNTTDTIRGLVARNGGDTVACVSAASLATLSADPAIQARYVALPPLRGPAGVASAYYNPYADLTTPRACILAASGRQEIAIAWLDACYDEEAMLRARFGETGTDWEAAVVDTTAADGGPVRARVLIEQWGVRTYAHWFDAFPSIGGLIAAAPAAMLQPAGVDPAAAAEYQGARAAEPYVTPCAVPPLTFDTATAAAIDGFCRNAITGFISGAANINDDRVWAEYIAQVKALGLDGLLAAMQASYDAGWRGRMPSVYQAVAQRSE